MPGPRSARARAPRMPSVAIAAVVTWVAACSPAVAAAQVAAAADSGFLEQYAATLGFRLGQPSSIRMTPDGDAVLFLRSGPRSFVHDLWEFDVATRRERVLLTADQVLRGANEK